jgi:hypothetical protein
VLSFIAAQPGGDRFRVEVETWLATRRARARHG